MLLEAGALPDDPLAAAAEFYARVLPTVAAVLEPSRTSEDPLLLVFRPADHRHQGWRLAAVQALARAAAPRRVNALASNDARAIAAAEAYLDAAPGVTGQLLALDGTGAGEVLS